MNVKSNKGSITVFVLVGLLFMSGFLIISYGSIVNKSKFAKEQFDLMSEIYSYNDGDAKAYERAYTELRKGTKQSMSSYSTNSSTLELTKTYADDISNFRIYGNSIQDGTPSPDNPVEIESVGNLVTDTTDENYGKYNIPVKVTGKNLVNISDRNIKYTGYYHNYFPNNPKLLLQPSTTYTLSFNYVINSATATVACGIGYGTSYYAVDIVYSISYPNQTQGRFEYTFTTPVTFSSSHTPYLQLRFARAGTSATIDVDISNVQVELGSQATVYEPYKAQTVNIYLDEPLRKIGNKADYIDFSTGKVVRNVRSITVNTSEMNNDETYPGWKTIESIKSIKTDYSDQNTRFANVAEGMCNVANFYAIGINTQSTYYILFFLRDSIDLSQTEWKTNYPNLDINILYGLSAGYDSETIELPQLSAYEDYTNIEVLTDVAPSKISAEYIGYTFE